MSVALVVATIGDGSRFGADAWVLTLSSSRRVLNLDENFALLRSPLGDLTAGDLSFSTSLLASGVTVCRAAKPTISQGPRKPSFHSCCVKIFGSVQAIVASSRKAG